MSTLVAITTSLFSSQATLRLATLVFAGARDGFVNHVAQVVGGDAGKGLTHLAHGLIEIKSGHCGRCGKQQTFRRENTHYTWVAQLWSIGECCLRAPKGSAQLEDANSADCLGCRPFRRAIGRP